MRLAAHVEANLGWVRVLLNPKVPYGSPIAEESVDYCYIGTEILGILEELGLPVKSLTPFMFDYVQVLGPCLPQHADPDRFFNALVDLLFREWQIWFGRKTFLDSFGRRAWWQKTAEEYLERRIEADGLEVFSQKGRRMEPWVPEAKWVIDSIVFRPRAVWDLLLIFISEDVLGFEPNAKTLEKQRRELLRKAARTSLTEVQQRLVEVFCDMTGNLEWLKNYRDIELHRIGHRFLGALEHQRTEEYVWDIWGHVKEEHNRAREGLMAVLGTAGGELA